MKILFLAAHLRSGGAERTVSYLASYLSNSGWDVTVLSISNDVFYSFDSKVNVKTLSIPERAKGRLGRYLNAYRRVSSVRKFLKNNKQDVVFCMLPDVAKYVLPIQKKMGFKLITSERNNPAFEIPKVQKFKEKLYRKCDGLIFQTERARAFYCEQIQNKSVVIHNAVGNKLVYELPIVKTRKKKIVAIGRVSKQKDYTTLLRAFSMVVQRHPEYVLQIYGDTQGDYAAEIMTQVQQELLQEKVIFMGAHQDAIAQVNDAACYVMSSIYEGMPNALMEAMGAGIPCVCTDCPNGPSELIENGVNGLLVPVQDPTALAGAILKMIENPKFAEICANNARKILQTHSVDVKAAEYESYIERIANQKGVL